VLVLHPKVAANVLENRSDTSTNAGLSVVDNLIDHRVNK
jgi:hypothetical protein